MLLGSEILISKLWNDFQSYIQGNWTLPIEFGIKDGKVKKRILSQDFGDLIPLQQVQPQIKFCQVLCEILKHSLVQKNKIGFKVPHENTMRNFLKSGLAPTTQKNTLNAFAAFLGYEHWDDYRRKNNQPITQQETKLEKDTIEKAILLHQTPIEQSEKKIKEKKKKLVRPGIYGAALLLLIIVLFIFSPFNNKKNESDIDSFEQRRIIRVINKANKAEFEAYAKLPLVDTSSLDPYFVNAYPEGSARTSIIGALLRRKNAGCILSTSTSFYNLIDVKVVKIQDTIAYLHTSEKWHLRWFDTLQKKEVLIYDTTNKHDYILVKRNQSWKILMDNYEGKLKKPSFAVAKL